MGVPIGKRIRMTIRCGTWSGTMLWPTHNGQGCACPRKRNGSWRPKGTRVIKNPRGEDWDGGRRVCWDGQKGLFGETVPVASHPKGVSPFGIYQQSGNVWERCADWFESNAYQRYSRGDFSPPKNGSSRVLRGGSWFCNDPRFFRSTYRLIEVPECRLDSLYGFRLARTVTP